MFGLLKSKTVYEMDVINIENINWPSKYEVLLKENLEIRNYIKDMMINEFLCMCHALSFIYYIM